MLFFKKKSEEILPPPPPFPSMELEEKEKPVLFDETIKPEKAKALPEEKEFEDLLKEFKEEKPKKIVSKAKKKEIKKPKVLKKEVKKAKIVPIKKPKQIKKITPIKVKEKPIPQKIKAIKLKEKPFKKLKTGKPAKIKETELPELEEEFKELGFELPKEFQEEKEIGLPEELEETKELELPEELEKEEIELPETFEPEIEATAEELGVGKLKETKTKPKEIVEAEEEIKSAIEKIKEREKPSLLKRLFGKKEKIEEKKEEPLFKEIPEVNDVSKIQNKINKAREALMKLDLESAKNNYIEIMKTYNILKPEEQAKVYHDVRDLYFERKSAEELKV